MTVALMLSILPGSLFVSGCRDTAEREERIRQALAAGRFEESVQLLEEALRESPDDSKLLFLYGNAQLSRSRPSLALFPLLRARDDPEWSTRAGLALIQVGVQANDREQSIDAATRVLEEEPENVLARTSRAESFIHTKAYEAALDDANWLIDRDESEIAGHVIRLQALIGLKRMEEIDADFDRIEAIWRDDAFPRALAERYCTARAVFADEKGDREEAEGRFEGCLESFPGGRGLLPVAVSFFDRTGASARATEILEGAVAREPTAVDLREALATRLRSAGETDRATELLLEGTRESGSAIGRAWVALAYHYFALERFEESVGAWQELLEVVPEPGEASLLAYAEALVQAERFDEAREVAQRLPESMRELLIGLMLLEQGEPEKALSHFDAGQRLWPNNATARYFAGLAAERAFDIDRAIVEFRHSIRIDVEETPSARRLARILEAEGNLESARTALAHHYRGWPADWEGRLAALRVEARIRGPRIITRAFSAQRWPRHELGPIVAQVARIATEVGDAGLALNFLLSRGAQLDFERPENADAMRALVEALASTGQAEKARMAIGNALEDHPDSASFHEIQGGLLEQIGAGASEIRVAHDRALELDPEHARSLAALARLALQADDAAAARRLFERAAVADPRQLDARRRAAELAALDGDDVVAERLLVSLLADEPTDARAATLLAGLLLEDRPERALRLARAAVRFGGGSDSYAMLNRACIAVGRPEQAVAMLASTTSDRGDDPSLHYHLGQAMLAAGRREEAIQSFEQAISVAAGREFPERSEAQAALAQRAISSVVEGAP